MPGIRVSERERGSTNFEAVLRRFKRAVEKAGVLNEIRKRTCFIKPSEEKKRARASAVRRLRKRLRQKDQKESTGRRRG